MVPDIETIQQMIDSQYTKLQEQILLEERVGIVPIPHILQKKENDLVEASETLMMLETERRKDKLEQIKEDFCRHIHNQDDEIFREVIQIIEYKAKGGS